MKIGKREQALIDHIRTREIPVGASIRKGQERAARKLEAKGLAVLWLTPKGYRWFLTEAGSEMEGGNHEIA